jgi:hypothetical protein
MKNILLGKKAGELLKKEYQKPEMEKISFDEKDIICTSAIGDDAGEDIFNDGDTFNLFLP